MPPPEIILDILVKAILPAAGVAGFLLWLAHRVGGVKLVPYGAIFGFVGGALLGQTLSSELALAPGESSWNRLPLAAVIALVAGVLFRQIKSREFRWGVQGIVIVGLVALVLPEDLWKTRELSVLYIVACIALWLTLEPLSARPVCGDVCFSLAATFLTASLVFAHAATSRLMDASIVLFATYAGLGVIAAWKRLDVAAVVPSAAILLPGLLLRGQQGHSTEVHWLAFVLPAIAPLMLAVSCLLKAWPEKRVRIVRFALVAIPLIAALVLARLAGPLEF